MIRIGILISGSGTNMSAIIEACRDNTVSGEVVFVGADVPEAKGLKTAREKGVAVFSVDYAAEMRRRLSGEQPLTPPPGIDVEEVMACFSAGTATISSPDVKQRLIARLWAENRMLSKIQANRFDLLVLAGYMRLLTPYFIDQINAGSSLPRIMNIHPALLPAFPGTDGYGETFRYGCKVGGCTVHFVDYGEDTGPIIGQKSFPIESGDTLSTVRTKGLQLEWQLYPECIELFAQRRLKLIENQYRLKDGTLQRRTVVQVLPPQP